MNHGKPWGLICAYVCKQAKTKQQQKKAIDGLIPAVYLCTVYTWRQNYRLILCNNIIQMIYLVSTEMFVRVALLNEWVYEQSSKL